MVGYDPISADMVRPCSDVPDACPIDAELIAGWLIDLSVGGALILVDQQRLDSAARTTIVPARSTADGENI